MTGIKPTVSLFRVWQRELDGVLAHFSTTYTFYYYGYVLTLPWSSCYSSHVTYCDCDHLSHHCDKATWYFPMLHLVVVSPIRKEKKRKRNINNNLAVLPSHDNQVIKSQISKWLFVIHWEFHISTDIDYLKVVLGSFWVMKSAFDVPKSKTSIMVVFEIVAIMIS